MTSTTYVFFALCFAVGFFCGGFVCYAVLDKVYKHKKFRDELLKSERDLATAKTNLDILLKGSVDMFNELDIAHKQYAKFLKDAATELFPEENLTIGSDEPVSNKLDSRLQGLKKSSGFVDRLRLKDKGDTAKSAPNIISKSQENLNDSAADNGAASTPKAGNSKQGDDDDLDKKGSGQTF